MRDSINNFTLGRNNRRRRPTTMTIPEAIMATITPAGRFIFFVVVVFMIITGVPV